MPYFAGAATNAHEARAEIIDTRASYATRTRGELLLAAQIIALGMTTLDVLAEAKTAEMSLSTRTRSRSCANGLNRATIQTEKALHRRLACEQSATLDAINDIPDAEVPARSSTSRRTSTSTAVAFPTPVRRPPPALRPRKRGTSNSGPAR